MKLSVFFKKMFLHRSPVDWLVVILVIGVFFVTIGWGKSQTDQATTKTPVPEPKKEVNADLTLA